VLFRGGRIVTVSGIRALDVRVRHGRIAEIGEGLQLDGDEAVELDGLHVLPGAIDPHGHQWEPGFTPRPDFAEVTASAAVGGVTTLLDHPLTPPLVLDVGTFEAKAALGERTAIIDFGLHGGASPDTTAQLESLWAAGATGIKVFTCRTGTALDGFDDAEALAPTFAELARLGAMALVHAEDERVLTTARAALVTAGRDGVADFPAWHDRDAETRAVDWVLALAAAQGTRVYLVHASQPAVVRRVLGAEARGATVYLETCPHYLHLTDADLVELGGIAMTAPPVRDVTARDGLRAAVRDRSIDTIGSDHCAIALDGKTGESMGSLIPGVPGLDVYLPLLLELVADGGFDLPRVAEVTAAAPARIFGLPSKGSIDVGRDADLAVVDLDATTTVRAADLPCTAGWSPYEGRTLRGRVVQTWSRGALVAREGAVLADPGRGRLLRRSEVVHGVR
jgi:dihydroorotase/allantoinase